MKPTGLNITNLGSYWFDSFRSYRILDQSQQYVRGIVQFGVIDEGVIKVEGLSTYIDPEAPLVIIVPRVVTREGRVLWEGPVTIGDAFTVPVEVMRRCVDSTRTSYITTSSLKSIRESLR